MQWLDREYQKVVVGDRLYLLPDRLVQKVICNYERCMRRYVAMVDLLVSI